jgi:hypothetical protein
MAAGLPTRSKYAEEMVRFAEDEFARYEEWFDVEDDGRTVPEDEPDF